MAPTQVEFESDMVHIIWFISYGRQKSSEPMVYIWKWFCDSWNSFRLNKWKLTHHWNSFLAVKEKKAMTSRFLSERWFYGPGPRTVVSTVVPRCFYASNTPRTGKLVCFMGSLHWYRMVRTVEPRKSWFSRSHSSSVLIWMSLIITI